MFSTISFVGYSIYELISIPLYLRIIYILITKKEFSAPFFRFLSVIGILEICHFVIDVVFYRLPIFGPTSAWFGTSPSPLYSVGTFLIYFFNYPIYVLHIAIALNRCSSVWVPVQQKHFWRRVCMPIIGFAFALSLAFTAHRLITVAKLVPLDQTDPSKGAIPIIVTYQLYFIDSNLLTASFNSFVFISCLIINCFTLYKIVQLKRGGMLENNAQKIELNLFIVSIWMSATMIVIIIFQLSLFMLRTGLLNNVVDVGQLNYLLFMQQPLVEILGTESHPWLLLVMCQALRAKTLPQFLKKLKKRLLGKNGAKSATVVTVSGAKTVGGTVKPKLTTTTPFVTVASCSSSSIINNSSTMLPQKSMAAQQ